MSQRNSELAANPGPVPPPNEDLAAEFWARCSRDELWIQRCADCGTWQYYPRHICSHCQSLVVVWQQPSGVGTVETFSVVQRATGAFAKHSPYVVAVIRLAEGPTMLTQVVGADPELVSIGMPVKVAFHRVADRVLPLFEPAAD